MAIAVAIVEDDPLVRGGVVKVLNGSNLLHVVGAVGTAHEALALNARYSVDVFLVDIGLPDMMGNQLIAKLRLQAKWPQCMVLSSFGDARHINESLRSGASGYILKEEISPSLVEKIVKLHNGGVPLSPAVARVLVDQLSRTSLTSREERREAAIQDWGLAPREVEVLDHLATGLPVALIADKLNVSPNTVNQHLRSIYRKLNVHSRAMAVYAARAAGITHHG
ncbi:response regulator [Ideonella sp.]|jgi:DNA-binding NarL/FixJ family response regulator|uniref:response regulator n=1 Tax=Ideonella sp. TaxID=1929293 RepID=UPI0037BFCAB7